MVLCTSDTRSYLDLSIIYPLPGPVHFMSGVTHMETDFWFVPILCLQIVKVHSD